MQIITRWQIEVLELSTSDLVYLISLCLLTETQKCKYTIMYVHLQFVVTDHLINITSS